MDKQEVLKEYRKTEDRILLSQVLDKIEIAEKRNQIQYTDFLDMYQVALVKKFLNKKRPPHTGCDGRDGGDLAVTVYFFSCGLGRGFSGR